MSTKKQEELVISTRLGNIIAIPSTDPLYPGIFIEVNGRQVALIEYDGHNEQHILRVWDYKDSDGDYIYKQVLIEEEY